jgi:hypothetical protein
MIQSLFSPKQHVMTAIDWRKPPRINHECMQQLDRKHYRSIEENSKQQESREPPEHSATFHDNDQPERLHIAIVPAIRFAACEEAKYQPDQQSACQDEP